MPKRTKDVSDEEHSEEENEELTSNKKQKSNTSSDVGIIEKIVLENFMCHHFMEIQLGTNINFIVGVNGSMYSFYHHKYHTKRTDIKHTSNTCKHQISQNTMFLIKLNIGGKSAVLIGLAICLGAKAGFTSRASKLSDLIKTGSQYALFSLLSFFLSFIIKK